MMMQSDKLQANDDPTILSMVSETNEIQVEQLVEQFRDFLQQENTTALHDKDNTQQSPVTLFNLFTELSALKNEVKRESMQVKDAVGQFGTLLDTLKESNQQLSAELEQRQKQKDSTAFGYRLSAIEDVFDLNDSLERTLESLKHYKPSWWEKRSKQGSVFRQDTVDGLEITVRRIKKLFQKYDIESIECLGGKLDPHRMKVVKVMEDNKQANGIILAEIRKGYERHGEVIRLAEVAVNKIDTE